MIRLNDINKTVIDEKSINEYYSQDEMGLNTIRMIICGTYENVMYSTKEARNDDISLLDQLLEVKDIKEQVEIEKLKKEVASHDMGITSELASEYISNLNACAPVKQEEYLTWDEVKNSKKKIKVKMPNGDNRVIFCDDGDIIIARIIARNDYREGRIYKEDLFNALKLKKVE
jgi:hypothetical protein